MKMDLKQQKDVFEWFDGMALNRFHAVLFTLCTLTLILLGYNSQIVAYIIPLVLKEWRLTSVEAGAIASYTFLGLLIGAAGFGMISDRLGRKRTLMVTLSLCTVFSGGAYFAPNFLSLCVLRFLAGLGIGGSIPLVITLITEYAPPRIRARVLSLVFAGFPLGWALAAVFSMLLIPHFGWRIVLLAGGILTLLLLPPLWFFLPESVRFFAEKMRFAEAVGQIKRIEQVARLDHASWNPQHFSGFSKQRQSHFRELFRPAFKTMTILLWVTYVFTMIALYGMVTWLPQLLVTAGFSVVRSYSYGLVQAVGSLFGGFVIGFLLDHFGRKPGLLLLYLFSSLSIVAFSIVNSEAALYIAGFATGIFILSAPNALHVVAGETYPTHIRSTGVGCGQAASRLGSILGPLIGGMLQMAGLTFAQFFVVFSLPCFVCMGLICFFKVSVKGSSLKE
jgi:AAHS family benzoate transporter-like MFS transporter